MKKSLFLNILIWSLCLIIIITMMFCFGVPIRVNEFYNYAFKTLTSQTELYGYEISDNYFVEGNRFSIVLDGANKQKKSFTVILDYFTRIKGYSVDEFSQDRHLNDIKRYENIGLINRVNEFNTVFSYNHIDKSLYLEYKDNVYNVIRNNTEIINELNSCKENIVLFREELVNIYNYYKNIYFDLEELQSFEIFCDRLIDSNMFYDVTNKRVGFNIDFKYKVHNLGFMVYFDEGGVVYVEK